MGVDSHDALILVMATGDTHEPLALSGRQLDGPGRMGFRHSYDEPVQAALTLTNVGMRSAAGWPPHWGILASVSAPGCWSYEITYDDGHTDQIVVQITPDDFDALAADARHEPHELQ